MLQTINCIRMGEVLFDENQQLLILCNNCHTDLRTLQDFRQHLEKCEGLENIFEQGRLQFKYNTDKSTQLFGKTLNGIKEFLIHDYNDVEVTYTEPEESYIDLINIEEELLDPKWYSDLNVEVSNTSSQKSSKQYDELVEAVTPFVQFKENLKSNNNGRSTAKSILVKPSNTTEFKTNAKQTEKTPKNVKFDLTTTKTRPPAKRKLSMVKTVPIHFATQTAPPVVNITSSNTLITNTTPISQECRTYASKKPKMSNGFIKPLDANTTTKNTQKNTNTLLPPSIRANVALNNIPRKTTIIPTTIINPEPTKEKQTAQILNKLQNLGLQVKRTHQLPRTSVANSSAPSRTDTKTLEILQKLQSKGMKVKILNKQQTTETNNIPMVNQVQALVHNPVQKLLGVINNSATNTTIKQSLNKNLIIKKVN